MKRYCAWILALLLTMCLFCSCGAESAANDMGYAADGKAELEDVTVQESIASSAGTGNTAMPEGKKIVRKLWLDAETENLDELLSNIDQRIAQLDGYIEQREVYHGSTRTSRSHRYANITIRIPVAQMHEFAAHVSQNANVTSSNETAENITLTYVATESRMKALETEQTRLLELLAKAENMDDLLQIESRLTDVRTELEEVTSQLRVYDNLVDYGTIHLNLSEVKEFTVVEEPDTVWERMGKGFMESLKTLGTVLTELFVFLVCALPWLIPVALLVTFLLLWHRLRKRNTKSTAGDNDPDA